MSETTRLSVPLKAEVIQTLRAGDSILLSGDVYTARDAAHQRLLCAIEAGEPLPIPLAGQVIYYCGPSPTPPGRVMGSAGPTSSYRMDPYALRLHELGLKATIGKGDRSLAVRESCQIHGALYLVAVGGAGALLADRVISADIIAYEDLGPEAIRHLVVVDLPLIVAYDVYGSSVFPGDAPLSSLESGA